MQHDQNAHLAWLKMAVAWVLTIVGGITLQGLVQTAALIYTCLQIYLLVRTHFGKRRITRKRSRA